MLDLWRSPEGAGDPVGCLATTYTFHPGLFDEQCLARFLEIESEPDREDLAFLLERETRLGGVYAGVLVDHTQAGVEHSLRWDVLPVYRIQRRPWPEMTERVGALLDEFPGPATHDATGAGSAIGEFPALAPHDQLQGVTMVGRGRVDLFRNYIAAIERHEIVCPRIDVFYTEHLYCGEDDLFGSGHPPDTVVAMALAYHAFKTGRQPGDLGFTL